MANVFRALVVTVGMAGCLGSWSLHSDAAGAPVESATAAQKARKVLEELRRRLSDPNRDRDELDYLERLIKPD